MSPPSAVDIEAVRDTEAIVLPDPLTVSGVAARRAKAGKLVAGTASYASSESFKSPVSQTLTRHILC
jgi:aromatic amino acid aminotransferase I